MPRPVLFSSCEYFLLILRESPLSACQTAPGLAQGFGGKGPLHRQGWCMPGTYGVLACMQAPGGGCRPGRGGPGWPGGCAQEAWRGRFSGQHPPDARGKLAKDVHGRICMHAWLSVQVGLRWASRRKRHEVMAVVENCRRGVRSYSCVCSWWRTWFRSWSRTQ